MILFDYLGSTSLVTNASGAMISEMRYTACPTPLRCGGAERGRSAL